MISTSKIFSSIKYYHNKGYRDIDVPLVVDEEVSALTKPESAKDFRHSNDKVYVGSAEQSFIQLYKDGELPYGKYLALTPCLRDEEFLDELHYQVFLKLELIHLLRDTECWEYRLDKILRDAYHNFSRWVDVRIIETELGYDIVDSVWEVELGSYGVREMPNGTKYIYGTGIAEPRLSHIMNKEKEDLSV